MTTVVAGPGSSRVTSLVPMEPATTALVPCGCRGTDAAISWPICAI
jgi:hypothetical protein